MPFEPEPDRDTRFLADVMLGSLARWLRLLGYDTTYDNGIDDDQIARTAVREDRVVLTRDTRLCRRRALRDRHVLISSQRLEAQLRQVLEELHLPPPARPLRSRCVRCNGELEPLPRAEVRDRVPPYVWKTQQEFKRCPGCGRIFWDGTHRRRMLDRLARLASSALQSPEC